MKTEERPETTPANLPESSGFGRPRRAPTKLFEPTIVRRATKEAFLKLNPRLVAKNPVMFGVEVGSVVTTYFTIRGFLTGDPSRWFTLQTTFWLWFTVIFAN